MVSRVTLPDARIPIGHTVINGRPVDILVDDEWMRAFTDLIARTGGTSAPSTPDVLDLINRMPPVNLYGDSGEGGGESLVILPTGPAALISVQNEATDTTCFVIFVTAATGDLAPKTNAALTFNSFTGTLDATLFDGPATQVVLANEATDTTCFLMFATDATGNVPPKSNANLTFNSNTNAFATGSVRAVGGEAPSLGADAVHAWVTGGVPVLSFIQPSNALNARIADFIFSTAGGGTFSGRFVNDAISSTSNWVDVLGTSAAITTVTFPNGTVVVTNSLQLGADVSMSRTAANVATINDSFRLATGGVAASVSASNMNLWVSGNSSAIDFVDISQAVNSKIANFVFQSGSFVGRFINDAYNAATNWVTVVGTSAAITSITFPVITVTGAALFNGNVTLGDAAADTITVTGTPAGQVVGSTYSPTASAAANLDATPTPSQAQYMRVGATVTVSGTFTADPTAPGAASFELTLPVASNIGAVEDCAGVAFAGGIAGQGAAITGSVANNTAVVSWIAVDLTSQAWSYQFTYQII